MGGRVKVALKTGVRVHADDAWLGLSRACGALSKALKAQTLQVVLSDSLVRYASFPWRDELRTADEDIAFARLSFDDIYGANASDEWHLAFSLARPGESRLMVAVPKSLYDLLSTSFSKSLPTVKSIQTSFTRALTTHRRALPSEGWMVNLEDDSTSFGSWNTQGWTWVNTIRHSHRSPVDLAGLLNQELTISGVNLSANQLVPVAVRAPSLNQAQLPQLDGVRFIPLKSIEPVFAPLKVAA
jgi:hypothetical protein